MHNGAACLIIHNSISTLIKNLIYVGTWLRSRPKHYLLFYQLPTAHAFRFGHLILLVSISCYRFKVQNQHLWRIYLDRTASELGALIIVLTKITFLRRAYQLGDSHNNTRLRILLHINESAASTSLDVPNVHLLSFITRQCMIHTLFSNL